VHGVDAETVGLCAAFHWAITVLCLNSRTHLKIHRVGRDRYLVTTANAMMTYLRDVTGTLGNDVRRVIRRHDAFARAVTFEQAIGVNDYGSIAARLGSVLAAGNHAQWASLGVAERGRVFSVLLACSLVVASALSVLPQGLDLFKDS
jgi:hypothetical protein